MSRSKDDFKWITKWLFLFSALMTLFFIWLATKQEQYETKAPVVLPSPTPTVEPDIMFINGIPTAVSVRPTEPQKATPTPKPTNSPTATVTPVYEPHVASYGKGKAGTYKAEVNGKHGFKPLTSYTAYTAKGSQQYKLQQIAVNGINGIRVVTDSNGVNRYCIALGTSWAGGSTSDIGRLVDVRMANGWLLKCVLADVKRVEDTVSNEGYYGRTNNDCLEFIVSQKQLNAFCGKTVYDCSDIGTEFRGDVAEITVYDEWIDGFGKEN